MGNLPYLIAVLLVIAWSIGYAGYNAGGIFHGLLVVGLAVLLVRFIVGNKPV